MEALSVNSAAQLKADGFRLVTRPIAIAAFDPAGEGDDNAALTVLQREEWQCGETHEPKFATIMVNRVILAERMPPSNEFPQNKARLIRVARKLHAEPFFLTWRLVIESNGLGVNYLQDLRNRMPMGTLISIATVAQSQNDKAAGPSGWIMPRQAGLDNLRAGLEMQLIKIVRGAPWAIELGNEFRSMVWNGRRPEAQSGAHDDLVMSLALGYWTATKILGRSVKYSPDLKRAA